MANRKLELFYSPACPKCPTARKFMSLMLPELKEMGVEVVEVNSWLKSGMEKAMAANCMASPCIALDGKAIIRGASRNIDEFKATIRAALAQT